MFQRLSQVDTKEPGKRDIPKHLSFKVNQPQPLLPSLAENSGAASTKFDTSKKIQAFKIPIV